MENYRASVLMVLAMALFAIEDMFTKLLSARLPIGQILAMLGAMGMVVFWVQLRREGGALFTRDLLRPVMLVRNAGEVIGGVGFVSALVLTDISSTSAILQAAPLMIMLGAWLFLGESVGWRRWLAIAAGFVGVLLIVKPGMSGFEPLSILAVIGVAGLAARDIATRRVPQHIRSNQLSASAFGALIPAGIAMDLAFGQGWEWPTALNYGQMIGGMIGGVAAYTMLVTATRIGEASVIAPFRYTRLIFALAIGVTLFGERPDALTLTGAAIIAAAGGFAMWREAALRRRKLASIPPGGS
ncbi:MAG: DMT family transporter [Paracoccus sp. (in: a-proteobacteria)]|nr:DMT family transporter [Paracoccus sp. (in: a-proteobacteria)]